MGIRILFSVIILFISFEYTIAIQIQDWGEVTADEWAIDSFEDDEDAHSIILFDYGESYIDNNIDVIHTRHKRIKILNPEQSDYTDIRIPIYDDRNVQRLRRISAQTINRGTDGRENIIEIGRRDFFNENSGDWEITTFTFPALETGSIVEYKYTIIFKNPLALPDWVFQHNSPVIHSEYRVMVPDNLSYRAYSYGFKAFEETHDDQEIFDRMNRYANAFRGNSERTFYRSVLKNAPAIRSEPYITSLDNYRNRVKYQLIGYRDISGKYTSYMDTWEEIAEQLMDARNFGGAISTRRNIRRTTEEIVAGLDNDLEKSKVIYEFVASNIQWDNRFRVMTSDRARNILDDLSGNSSDKAILLISMLRAADLEAYPVLISTRKNGKVDWTYPTLNSFNHVLVLLNLDGTIHLLDPLNKLIPFGVLHPSSINESGLLIQEDETLIVDIMPQISSSSQTVAIITLNNDGSMASSLRTEYMGYEAIIHRSLADSDGEEDYLENNILEFMQDSKITNSDFRELENPDNPFTVELELENERYATVAGDMIYLNPFLVERITENPFNNPVREFPVEFNFGTRKQYTATILIPKGYEVLELPENKSGRFTENMGYDFICQESANSVQLRMVMVNNEQKIETEFYDDLRSYFSSVADVYNQQIVLRKLPETDDSSENNIAGEPKN